MTIHEIVTELPKLTLEERLTLLDALTQSLRTTLTAPSSVGGGAEVFKLYGAWKTDEASLTDADVDQLRYDALMEKYL